jgi:D-beta-D-heptose 7-phosphate kinase/D-beta-D-heptose 1-phosphate adenosyltransferase
MVPRYDLPDFSKLNILVLGDLMLDEYIWGNVERISPEAPVPVVKVTDKTYRLGGAGNVSANLAGLGCTVNIIGVVGKDTFGQQVDLLLREKSIHNKSIIVDSFSTTCKTRIMGLEQQLVRIDQEDPDKIKGSIFERLWQIFKENTFQANAVVLSDYGKGVLTPPFVKTCIEYCRAKNIPVFVDPKANDWDRYRNATCATPNVKELADICQVLNLSNNILLNERGFTVRKAFGFDYLLVTRGNKGMVLFQRGDDPVEIPAQAREVFDVSGAGDTVIAVLAAAYAAGCSMPRSMELANLAAEVVVGKVGTYPVSFNELHNTLRLSNEGFRHKICSLEQSTSMVANWRDQGEIIVFTNGCFDLLHTGHIHLLQAAAKEGDRLVVGLNTDASVRKLKGPARPVLTEQDRASILSALECVDMVVLFAEETPIKLIQTFKPDVIVKGRDYSKNEVVGGDLVERWGGKVVLVPLEKGKSTSDLIESINNGTY